LVIPDTVTKIGSLAFNWCSALALVERGSRVDFTKWPANLGIVDAVYVVTSRW
jgi:hypothetical protein